MATTALIGATGMVGAFILSTLCSSPSVASIEILARRQPPSSASTRVKALVDAETAKWAPHIKSLSPPPEVFFSALATTRAAAGGLGNQWRLEHDLNVELAKAAKEAGSKVYVLISAANANKNSMFAYAKMKGEIEEDIKAIGFEHTVILQPSLIAGHREESRPIEAATRKVAGLVGMINTHYLKDPWAQEAEVIGKAAVAAGVKALQGESPSKIWVLKCGDIVRMGRTGWSQAGPEPH